jgi:deoxyribodipyrimidine photo-lyase
MRVGIVLFTRDLRVHDNPALHAACEECERVVPLFVLDDAVLERFGAPNRVAFLLDALHDLDRSLSERGGGLIVRRGDVVPQVVGVGGDVVYLAEDVSSYARDRELRLRAAGLDVVPTGSRSSRRAASSCGGGDRSPFTPYWNRWRGEPAGPSSRLPDGSISVGFRRSVSRCRRWIPEGGETAGGAA